MKKSPSTPVAEMTQKQFESIVTKGSARAKRALNTMLEDFERALIAIAQTEENCDNN
ncbi:hypothetical protein HZC21_05940 [Candidatus Peregrinibacteria bacterium]|nr:hypothetical protein [Candidatus Peregrinibacteria bacterium]